MSAGLAVGVAQGDISFTGMQVLRSIDHGAAAAWRERDEGPGARAEALMQFYRYSDPAMAVWIHDLRAFVDDMIVDLVERGLIEE
eukprot:CAMPEP_0206256880 /NCGR_PEP_ID=MMETSP0047_2-20121206/25025_1 /ASSEMBLY_ACC=CAM_ASM_000192 /TAXON_ID=195065 /ORGANISM="Chroomonas mesostigmatica_cf, Strain CCMP1168" /LENGTH=84 /DNA_ID=CAMNT_0053683393 /DNA_START=20 /DNA_END=274 /DNA_ORIENTATION=+